MAKRGTYKNCERCGKEHYEPLAQKGKKRFCSTNCANKANAKANSESKKGKKNPMYGKKPWNKGKKLIGKQKANWEKAVENTKWGSNGFKKGNKTKSQYKEGHKVWSEGIQMTKDFRIKVSEGKKRNPWKPTEEQRIKMSETHSGSKNKNWRGGITDENKSRFNSYKWHDITETIRKKYNYICQECGCKNSLEVHHIIPWRISKNNSEENLILLCKSCHMKIEIKLNDELF